MLSSSGRVSLFSKLISASPSPMVKVAVSIVAFSVANSDFDQDCYSHCKFAGDCGAVGTYCKGNGMCHNLFWNDDNICLWVEGGNCPESQPLTCEDAHIFNPDISCSKVLAGSYCKVNKSVPGKPDGSVCHSIGKDTVDNPCDLRTDGCTGVYTCEDAVNKFL